MREATVFFGAALAAISVPCAAAPTAHFSEVSYVAEEAPQAPAGSYRNPILPGFRRGVRASRNPTFSRS